MRVFGCVAAPPVLGEVSPSFLIQKKDETVDMFCEATATPEPTITWLKDHKELSESQRVTITNTRVQIRKLERGDGGMYTCTFKNVVGQVSHVIKLVIEGELCKGVQHLPGWWDSIVWRIQWHMV